MVCKVIFMSNPTKVILGLGRVELRLGFLLLAEVRGQGQDRPGKSYKTFASGKLTGGGKGDFHI